MYTQFFKKWFTGTPVNAKKAELETEFLTADSNLKFTAKKAGTEGNDITVEFVDPSDTDVELSLSVNGSAIAVILGTDAYGEIETTAEEIIDIIEDSEEASALVDVEAVDYDSGVVEELSETALEGGQYATPCRASKAIIIIDGTWYISEKPVDKWTEDGWYSATPSQL